MPPIRRQRWERLGTWGVGLACLVCAIWMVGDPPSYIADDAYFYLEIARHIAAGDGVTFNGLISTNGFHPLWQLLLVPPAAMTGGPSAYLVSVAILHAGLGVGAGFVVYRTLRAVDAETSAPVAVLPLLLVLGGLGTLGSEAALNAFMVATASYLVCVRPFSAPHTHITVGIVLGLLVLARLDNLFVAVPLVICLVQRRGRRKGARSSVIAIGLILPYLIWNLTSFGALMPISGQLKSSLPTIGPYIGGLSTYHLSVLGLLVPLAGIVLSRSARPPRRRLVWVLGTGAWGHGLYHYLFQHAASWYWYTVLPTLALGITGALALDVLASHVSLSPHLVQLGVVVSTLASSALIVSWTWRDKHTSPRDERREIIEAIDTTLSERAVVVTEDLPGRLQFWSDLRVIALDGLTTRPTFVRRLEQRGLPYLEQFDVEALVLGPRSSRVRTRCMERDETTCLAFALILLQWTRSGSATVGTLHLSRDDRLATYTLSNRPGRIELWRWPRP